MKAAYGRMYIGNGNTLVELDSTGSTLTTVLTFETGYIVTALSTYNNFLVIVISKRTGAFWSGKTKIVFWDLVSASWNYEYSVSDSCIHAIKFTGEGLLALGEGTLHRFSGDGFFPLIDTGSANADDTELSYGSTGEGGTCIWRNFFCWITQKGGIATYGRSDARLSPRLFVPLKLSSTGVGSGALASVNPSILLASDNSLVDKPYYFKTGSDTGIVFDDKEITFSTRVRIIGIRLRFEKLISGDSLQVDMVDDDDTVWAFGTATFADDGAVSSKYFTPLAAPEGDSFHLELTFTAGTVKVKPGILIYYESCGDPDTGN
jgi:hypothetical protein